MNLRFQYRHCHIVPFPVSKFSLKNKFHIEAEGFRDLIQAELCEKEIHQLIPDETYCLVFIWPSYIPLENKSSSSVKNKSYVRDVIVENKHVWIVWK